MLKDTSNRLADRMARGDVFEPQCPSRVVLRHMTSSWGVLSLIALRAGTHRFSELRRKVSGVSERMLAQTLQQLEGDHLLERKSYPVVPPRVEYTLTPLGEEAAKLVETLADWVEMSMPALRPSEEDAAYAPGTAQPPERAGGFRGMRKPV